MRLDVTAASIQRAILLLVIGLICLRVPASYGQAKLDRQVTSLVIDPQVAQPRISLSVRVAVKNAGTISVGPTQFVLLAQFAAGNVGNEYIDGLASGEERQLGPFTVVVPPQATAGYYFIRACMPSYSGEIPDLDPSNNCL